MQEVAEVAAAGEVASGAPANGDMQADSIPAPFSPTKSDSSFRRSLAHALPLVPDARAEVRLQLLHTSGLSFRTAKVA